MSAASISTHPPDFVGLIFAAMATQIVNSIANRRESRLPPDVCLTRVQRATVTPVIPRCEDGIMRWRCTLWCAVEPDPHAVTCEFRIPVVTIDFQVIC